MSMMWVMSMKSYPEWIMWAIVIGWGLFIVVMDAL